MRVGVLGAYGQLGTDLVPALEKRGWQVSAPRSADVDIRNKGDVVAWVEQTDAQAYINCAAYTAVDAAESDVEQATQINVQGAAHLANAIDGSRLIYVSTDYVFDGSSRTPYAEGMETNPASVYGRTKLAGEHAVLEGCSDAAVLRVSWVYGRGGNNFVKAILRRALSHGELRVVNDQYGAPCSSRSIAAAIVAMLDTPHWSDSLYHFGARPLTNWFEFARQIVTDALNIGLLADTVPVHPVDTASLNQAAKRPMYSALDTTRFESTFGRLVCDWRDELPVVLRQIREDGGLG